MRAVANGEEAHDAVIEASAAQSGAALALPLGKLDRLGARCLPHARGARPRQDAGGLGSTSTGARCRVGGRPPSAARRVGAAQLATFSEVVAAEAVAEQRSAARRRRMGDGSVAGPGPMRPGRPLGSRQLGERERLQRGIRVGAVFTQASNQRTHGHLQPLRLTRGVRPQRRLFIELACAAEVPIPAGPAVPACRRS